QEYLETLRRRKNKNDTLLRASRQRLSLWDITPAQIRQLEKRGTAIEYLPIISPANGTVVEKTIVAGSAVKAGQKLLRIADLSTVWVEGEIYEYEIPFVKVGMEAKIVLPDQPGKSLQGKVKYIYPYLQGDTRTAKVRVEMDNRDGVLKPDMYTHLHLKIDLGLRLVVPESAVLYAGDSRVVFLDLGNGRLQPRKIKTGVRNADDIEVLEGLQAGDKVVTSGNFLIAAESKLKAGIDQW
ncbi:MAG: efflux RND transporter periplasmic adaptor subunit, partial [Acidiferrobacterales bacterium]